MKGLRVVPGPVDTHDAQGDRFTERRGLTRRCADYDAQAAAHRCAWVIAVLGLRQASDWLAFDGEPVAFRLVLAATLMAWLSVTLISALWARRSRWFAKHQCRLGWIWTATAYLNLAVPIVLLWGATLFASLDPSSAHVDLPVLGADSVARAMAGAISVWWLAILIACIAALPMCPGLGHLAAMGLLSESAIETLRHADVAGLAISGSVAAIGCYASVLAARHRRAETRCRIETADRLKAMTVERDGARRADEDKRRFVAAASHDLRQPMHALGLFAATLERHLKGSADEALARNMIRSVEALDRSFAALLDLSRLDAGTVKPNVQRFPMRDLFRRLHMQFAGQAEEAGLGLRFSAGGKAVNSDPQLLERVLANLIQNALRYTQTGGVAVVVRSAAHQIKLEVWDSGCGIAEADLPRVFEEFYRGPDQAREHAQGLGMGLAIVKRLVVLLGHTLDVRSEPGRGTMFRIGIATGALAEVEDATAAADTIPTPFLEARCVLLIDDEAPIRAGLHMLLTEWGFEPIAAADLAGAEAAALQLGARLDLVVCDLHLRNGEDGLVVIERVRQLCGHLVPAILVTGDTSPAEIRRVSASGHMVLFKPVQPSKLFDVLRSLM